VTVDQAVPCHVLVVLSDKFERRWRRVVEGDGERDWGYRGLGGKGFHQLECNVVRMWGGVGGRDQLGCCDVGMHQFFAGP